MALTGKRIAVLVEQSYQEMEVWYPIYRLREAGATVVVLGTGTMQTYPSKTGYPCPVEAAISQVKAEDFDGVVIPGGYAPDHLRRYAEVNQFVADLNAAGKLVAAICHGGWVLCSARMLKGRQVTSFFAIRDDLEHAGAEWSDQETVVDGNLVTARKPDDLPAFMRAILGVLEG